MELEQKATLWGPGYVGDGECKLEDMVNPTQVYVRMTTRRTNLTFLQAVILYVGITA